MAVKIRLKRLVRRSLLSIELSLQIQDLQETVDLSIRSVLMILTMILASSALMLKPLRSG